jgi:hypothetical protein
MKTFHKIVAKYRNGEAKYTSAPKFVKAACVSIELNTHILKSKKS